MFDPKAFHLRNFFAQLGFFCGSNSSKDFTLRPFPFSISALAPRGVVGASSILWSPLEFLSFLGNVVLRGVKAVATRRAELRIFFRTSHDLFFACQNKIDEATENCQHT